MAAGDEIRHDVELPDEQFDQILETVSAELLDHIQARADLNRPLTAILAQNTTETPRPGFILEREGCGEPQHLAALIISIRSSAHDVAAALAGAHLLLRPTKLRGLKRRLGSMPGLSLDLDLARRLAERLIPVRVCVGEIVERFDLALGSDAADDLTTGRHLALRLSGAIDTLIRVRGRDHAVGERLCLAEKLVRDLESLLARRQVDASGADLSDTVIKHLDAVDGTIWTAQTIWPPAIADQVRAGSLETQPGVYQVQLGSQPDHSAAAQA